MSFIPAMLIAGTALCTIGNGNVQSTTGSIINQIGNNKNCIVQQQTIKNPTELKEFLNKKGICLQNATNGNCINNTPNCNIGNNKPGNSETEKPGNPEIEKPENGETSDSSYATQVVNLVNKEREKAGIKPLASNQKTADAALVRAKEIKQSFSHTRPNGNSFTTALKEQGVTYKSAGENIAWGQPTPEEVVSGWMNSEGHRANILSNNYTSIGVGHYENNGTSYWVQLFTS